jgi:ribosomal protein S18 acetylase RimI-like enzyme
MTVIALDHKDRAAIKKVAYLHKTLLPTSPIGILGSAFMEKFYYSRLLKDSIIVCDYYKHEKQIIGFIAYTKNPSNLLKKGFRKNPIFLCYLLTIIFARTPKKLIQILRVLQLEKAVKIGSHQEGAILSFGVLPEYRSLKFIKETGILISNELFQNTLQFFKREKILKLRMLVEQDNKEALLFYHAYGCRFKKIKTLGKSLVMITYKIR